jgi:hypothetical protein
MNTLARAVATALCAATLLNARAQPSASFQGISVENYVGWNGSLVMRAGDCKAIIVPAVGGRVLQYSINGENIIFENPASNGRTVVNTPRGFSVGGYQCDIGPELRGIPSHPVLWHGVWTGEPRRDYVAQVVSPPDPTVGLRLEKEFTMDPDSGELGIIQRMQSVATNEVSFCLWDRTLCKPDGFAFFPLNRRSRFKAGWSIRRGDRVGEYRYDGDAPGDGRVRIMDGVLVAQAKALPDARQLKVGADSDAGWIAYARGKILFVKYFPFVPGGNYTDGGNSVEFYCSERIAELEPLSPEIRLKPGEAYDFPEKWVLLELDKEVETFEQARALVKRVPKSPFNQ